MPHSDGANKPWSIEKIKKINPKTVLDCGVGSGIYLDLIKSHLDSDVMVHGIEAWTPYIEEFDLLNRYDDLFNIDVRECDDFKYDLVIFGDILEHMSKDDAINLWGRVSEEAKYALISIPIIHYPQGPAFGNPYEIHVKDDWNTQEVIDSFEGIVEFKEFDTTAVFIAKFN